MMIEMRKPGCSVSRPPCDATTGSGPVRVQPWGQRGPGPWGRRFFGAVLGLLTAAGAALAPPAVLAQAAAAPVAPAVAPAAAPAADYLLAAGDTIRILVFQNPDLTLEARVTEAGAISYPLLGSLRIAGQTVAQVERRIADGLRSGNFIKQPQVTVSLLQVRGNQASVLGQVNRPGRYPIESADLRLTDLLAIAGGVSTAGSERLTLVGTRNGQPFRTEVDLPKLFAERSRSDDVVIHNGDVIWVDRAPMIYIYGEVQRPGALRLERDMTVMQALASGGGLTLRGTEKGLRVHRKGPDGKIEVLQPSLDDAVRDADVIYVRESLF